jgi:hypothetical protein
MITRPHKSSAGLEEEEHHVEDEVSKCTLIIVTLMTC